jgi:SAM-dependent methyltransferase
MQDLEQQKSWYSAVADAYNRVRPRYPKELIGRVVELAQLQNDAIILEVGCGPGTATAAFAQLGFSYEVASLRANFLSLRFPSFKKPPQLSYLLRLNATRYQWCAWNQARNLAS